MRTLRRHVLFGVLLALTLAGSVPGAQAPAPAQATVTTPQQEFGHAIGADYELPNYTKLMAYWRKLEKESPRMKVVEIGKTAHGRPHLMSIVTSPANHQRLDRYKQIARQLALAEGLTDEQARELAREGKAVVWFDGGLHATETLGAQQLMETVYQLVSRNDEETLRILNDVIILAVHANPDGMELVSNWYMRDPNREQRQTGSPELYQKYAGHDNNRDFYMSALDESTNMNRVMYREWFPQIMYNHHQSGPQGTVMFAPPFRDPFNYNFHPMVAPGIEMVASAMHTRFITEGKPGVTTRRGANYSTWFNGGLRTTAYFHNIIGILTETIGNPTPGQAIPFFLNRQVPDSNQFWPIAPQPWKFRQSIDYSVTANYAIFDLASRYRETFLSRIYQMGKDEIKWGSEDHWTLTPHKAERVRAAMPPPAAPAEPPAGGRAGGGGGRGGFGGRGGGPDGQALYQALTSKELRDPRGFILPANQPDFGTAVKFVNALIKTGVAVHRATAAFTVAGKQYPAGSLVVKSAQAFRPHVMDMFEPQDHPDDFPYAGAPPTRPYDVAGYTLAYQMGVVFDRVLDGFDGPFEKLTDFARVPAGAIRGAQTPAGYYFSRRANDSFIVVNRLLATNEDVSWLANGPMGAGTFYVTAKPTTRAILQKAAADLGISFEGAATAPAGPAAKLRKLRIALHDNANGSMPSGWTRMILEQFEFPFTVVYNPDFAAPDLRAKYDVLVFNGSGLSSGGGGRGGGGRGAGGDAPAAGGQRGGRGGRGGGMPLPPEYARRQGEWTAAATESVKKFVQEGGSVIAIGGQSMTAATLFGLPVTNHLENVPQEKYYVPGSVLRVAVDEKNPVAHGIGSEVDVFFQNNPVFRLNAGAGAKGVRSVAWFPNTTPLRSGWAWGQHLLDKGVAMVDANVGKGRLFLFGPEILFRSQPHGTYKFFFNGLYLSVAEGLR